MSLPMWKNLILASSLVVVLGGTLSVSTLRAQKPAAEDKPAATEKKPRRALPAYYSAIVTEEQRTRIYSVQDKYESQIAALAEKIKAIQAERDAEIESVLTADQKKLLDKARADAKAKAQAKAAALKPTTEKPGDK